MHTFFGEGVFYAGAFPLWDSFQREGKFLEGEFFRKNFTLGEFVKNAIRNYSSILLSLYHINFTRRDVRGNCPR